MLRSLCILNKERLTTTLLYTGTLIAFLGSLNPWFMWKIGQLYHLPAAFCLVAAYIVSATQPRPIFTRNDFLLPILLLAAFLVYERISTGSNFNGYVMLLFRLAFFFAIFRLSLPQLSHLATFLCKAMGVLLIPSLAAHCLYLVGFPLPYREARFDEFYDFLNYYFFLVRTNDIFSLFPRFNGYFLEPSHIGAACAFLLFTQRGQWRRWYNVVLLAAVFFTFSVASYVYLVAIIIFNAWTAGQRSVRKMAVALSVLAVATVVTFTYNDGNNLVHDLIMLRLEIDDGEMAGDNRVTGGFQADFDNYIESSDIFFGRKFEVVEFGNAGNRVVFYDHGLVGILLLFAFYFASMMHTPNKRALIAVLAVAALFFWASAFMLWECVYLPFFMAAYLADAAPPAPPLAVAAPDA